MGHVDSPGLMTEPALGKPEDYLTWLKSQGVPLFNSGGTWWKLYRRVLVPASTRPEPVEIREQDGRDMLRRSGAYLVRHFSSTFEKPTDFWFVRCGQYDFDSLPGKLKTKIRRAYKDCTVRKVSAAWLAAHGHGCHVAAYGRYRHGQPDSPSTFQNECLACADGPFEFWAAFVEDELVAYAKCILEGDHVTMVAFKFNHAYRAARPVYALIDSILRVYVTAQHKQVNNGFRSISHDTQMQEFLLQFGFSRRYCNLKILYRPAVRVLVNLLYPAKRLINCAPAESLIRNIQTLLVQEEIRRSFASQALSHT
jgi:hypothetical protein